MVVLLVSMSNIIDKLILVSHALTFSGKGFLVKNLWITCGFLSLSSTIQALSLLKTSLLQQLLMRLLKPQLFEKQAFFLVFHRKAGGIILLILKI